jgi:hypothetical protein
MTKLVPLRTETGEGMISTVAIAGFDGTGEGSPP